jgi:BirA family biotin operon repressor/biotin-[acetyl-CoA-carboxylase] ligase
MLKNELILNNFEILTYDVVPSTNDIAKEKAQAGAAEGLVVHALSQTAGRGRRSNQWTSPKGNLYLSLVLRPKVDIQSSGQLSFVIACALLSLLKDKYGLDAQVKWPNDVLVEGKKISGILLESAYRDDHQLDYMIAGVGLNLVSAPEGANYLHFYKKIPLEELRDQFLTELLFFYHAWQASGFVPIRDFWLKNAVGLLQKITVRLPNQVKEGIFITIDQDGALILQTERGQEKIVTGDVFISERK